jgi:hypothetical protein
MAKFRTNIPIFIFSFYLFLLCHSCSPNVRGYDIVDEEREELIEAGIIEVIPAEESILNEPKILEEPKKPTLEEIYLSYVGVREATGKNDGPEVAKFLRAVGLDEGFAWCSAFAASCLDEAGIPHSINAWSPTAENRNNFVYTNNNFVKEPRSGDIFTIWYNSLKRIGHAGFYHRNQNEKIIVTVEGNTNDAGSREGDGVYKKYRSLNTIHSISRWE